MAAPSFLMPAEWEKHEATWIAWPHHRGDWPGKFAPIPWVYAEIVKGITLGEKARILVRGAKEEAAARDVLDRSGANMERVEFHHIPTNRVWLRDSGPIFVQVSDSRDQVSGGEGGRDARTATRNPTPDTRYLLNWRFNAWAKYANHRLDDKVPFHVAAVTGLGVVEPLHKGRRVVLEGGAIDVNGAGLLLTTEECLLSDVQCRNSGFTREDYEEVFARYLGIERVIWLGQGIAGDDTHGHVDDLARFVAQDTVVTVVEPDKNDKNHAPLHENLKRLRKTGLNVVELPMPRPVIFEKTRLPASYANFLITNAAVLVPVFNDPADRIALNTLAECFPSRQILPIYATDLVWGFGTLHCLSQQEPMASNA
jgi:agmatine deiminase